VDVGCGPARLRGSRWRWRSGMAAPDA
jgi:hypothetical protein